MSEIIYTVGFLFDPTRTWVQLIRKRRPGWQRGLLNGIGGHVMEGEGLFDAMRRECEEETGLDIIQGWELFCDLHYPGICQLGCFRYVGKLEQLARTMTDETIVRCRVNHLPGRPDVVNNLRWLIPLALDPQIKDLVRVTARLPADGPVKRKTG